MTETVGTSEEILDVIAEIIKIVRDTGDQIKHTTEKGQEQFNIEISRIGLKLKRVISISGERNPSEGDIRSSSIRINVQRETWSFKTRVKRESVGFGYGRGSIVKRSKEDLGLNDPIDEEFIEEIAKGDKQVDDLLTEAIIGLRLYELLINYKRIVLHAIEVSKTPSEDVVELQKVIRAKRSEAMQNRAMKRKAEKDPKTA